MAEQNQSGDLEKRLVGIGSLYHISRGIERSKSLTERSNLYLQLSGVLAKKDKDKEQELLDGTNYNSLEDMYLSHFRYGPETAVSFATQGVEH